MSIKINEGEVILVYYGPNDAVGIVRDCYPSEGWAWGKFNKCDYPVIKIKVWRSEIFKELHEN